MLDSQEGHVDLILAWITYKARRLEFTAFPLRGRWLALDLGCSAAHPTVDVTSSPHRSNGADGLVPGLRAQRTFYPAATAPYVMSPSASVSIHSEFDFQFAAHLPQPRNPNQPGGNAE